jgi:hypothetical protein
MRVDRIIGGLFATLLGGAVPAFAQTGPVYVVPGRPEVPVMLNGVDVRGAVVYGDWGLARPGHGRIIIKGPVALPQPTWWSRYYPHDGRVPRYGRAEVLPPPNRPLPPPAADYRRTWGAESDMNRPVTEYPPFDPPPVILAPRERRSRFR